MPNQVVWFSFPLEVAGDRVSDCTDTDGAAEPNGAFVNHAHATTLCEVIHSSRLERGDEREQVMCRNIKPLFNFDPPATGEEIHDAALQFVRKLSGTTKPSKRNEAAFEQAVMSIAKCAQELLGSLETSQPPRDREEVAAKARARTAIRFA